jgi:hypothetical protein
MNDWQMTYNGLTIGAGTSYGMTAIEGLATLPELRTADQDRTRAHGQFAGVDLFGGRDIDIEVTIVGKHPSSSVWQAFSAAFVGGQSVELPLVMQIPGVASGSEIQTMARVRKLSLPVDADYYIGAGRAVLSMHCTDPRLYSTTTETGSATQATTSGGLTFNATFNLSFGSTINGGFITLTNSGEFVTPWTATIVGPVTNPRIDNITSGQSLSISGSLSGSESLVLSSQDRTVLLNGTASRYSWLKSGSQWWDIPVGNTVLQFSGNVGGSGTLSTSFRSAWI